MKFRQAEITRAESEERLLEEDVRRLAAPEPPPLSPGDEYWPNMLVRVNRRIDDATSGRALSLSWAYRVAIPGVVAILSFLVGLHYYAPERTTTQRTLSAVVLSLPAQSADSLIADPEQVDPSLSVEDIATADPLEIPDEDAADYFIAHGGSTALLESMTDKQASEVLAVLNSETGRSYEGTIR
jgi:hypothetical protein